MLAQLGSLRIDDRIEGRRCFRQAGEHGGFGWGQVFQRFAEIDLCSSGKAVGALAKEYLVDVQLKNLVLAQVVLDFEGEQHFVELAGVGFLAGEEEIAGDLLGDGAGALFLAAGGQVHDGGACHAQGVDAAMLIEALVFGCQNGLFHRGRHIFDANDVATLFAKFADQMAVGGKYAQRYLRPIIGERFERRQVGVGQN